MNEILVSAIEEFFSPRFLIFISLMSEWECERDAKSIFFFALMTLEEEKWKHIMQDASAFGIHTNLKKVEDNFLCVANCKLQ